MGEIVYLNGEFKPVEEAFVHIDDRGNNFADGVYEVIAVFGDRPFKMEEHFIRLKASAEALDIPLSDYKPLMAEAEKLLAMNNGSYDRQIYVQVSRGTEPRKHLYSDNLKPTIFMTVRQLKNHPAEYFQKGVKVITAPDERWSRCYIKTISLLPNVITKKMAKDVGAFEAVQIRDGWITEGCSSNVFIVKDGVLITPPATNYILNGITRQIILAEAQKLGIKAQEKSICLADFRNADEVFLTGTTTEVMPVTLVDSQIIGDGMPGPVTVRILQHYKSLF